MLAKILEKESNRIILLLSITFLCFINVVNNGYSLDDHMVTTEENQLVSKGLAGAVEIFTSNYSSNKGKGFEYRPITILTFAIEYQLWGFNPTLSHFVNLILYLFLIFLIYRLLQELLPNHQEISFWITLLFALHPLHNEVVVSLKNREEILVTIFGILSFKYLLQYLKDTKIQFLAFSILFFTLGHFVKATIAPFAFFIPFSCWYFNKGHLKRMFLLFFVFVVINQIFYFSVSTLLLEGYTRQYDFIENPLIRVDLLNRIPTSFSLFIHYLKLFMFPYPLLSYYGLGAVSISGWKDFQFIFGFITSCIFMFVTIMGWKKRTFIGYSSFITLFLIASYLNFPLLTPGVLAERFAFLAVLGFSMFLIAILISFLKLPQLRLSLILLMSWYAIININRTSDWASLYRLFEVDSSKEIKSIKVLNTFAELNQIEANKHIDNPKEFERYFSISKKYYLEAIKFYPQNAGAYNNLGTLLASVGDYQNAKYFFEKAISLGYINPDVLYNVAALFELNNETQKAINAYKRCLEISPNYEDARKRLILLEGNVNSKSP